MLTMMTSLNYNNQLIHDDNNHYWLFVRDIAHFVSYALKFVWEVFSVYLAACAFCQEVSVPYSDGCPH